ncbi:MAG: hypothetical protein WC340_03755 [Kiritimatiellia bacterium]
MARLSRACCSMPLYQRHRPTMMCDDVGGRLGSCGGSFASIVAAIVERRRR